MNADFPRILSLLRKEQGLSQKKAAEQLGISQALLSHYEKGIRECGLDFLVRCADFYSVSCDYLLGRSPDRQGASITVDDIPDPDSAPGKENRSIGSMLPILNKKLIANSLNVLFDLLTRAGSKSLTGEVSAYLMLAVYRMFRVVYGANPKNQQAMFGVPGQVAGPYTDAAMQVCAANADAIAVGRPVGEMTAVKNAEEHLVISTDMLSTQYPKFSSSLFNLIQHAEQRIDYADKAEPKKRK